MTQIKTPPFLKSYKVTQLRACAVLRITAILFPSWLQRCHMYNDNGLRIASGWLHHESGCTFVTYIRDLNKLARNLTVIDKK